MFGSIVLLLSAVHALTTWNQYPDQKGGFLVYYSFDHSLPTSVRNTLLKHFNDLDEHTCLTMSDVGVQENLFVQYGLPFIKFVYNTAASYQCSSTRGYGGQSTQLVTIQAKCDDDISLGQMLLHTLGAEYEHRRRVARKYLTFAFEESEIRVRNCRHNGNPLTCTGCSRIPTTVTDVDHKESGAPYDPLSIMSLPSGGCSKKMDSVREDFMTSSIGPLVARSRFSAEDILGIQNLYCPHFNTYNFCDNYQPVGEFTKYRLRYPVSFRCDGTSDCFDGSDEDDCACTERYCAGASAKCSLGECKCRHGFELDPSGETSACFPEYDALCSDGYCNSLDDKCEIKSNTQTCLSKSFCGTQIKHNHLLPNYLEYRLVNSFQGDTSTCSSHVEINSKVFNLTNEIVNLHPVYALYTNSPSHSKFLCFRSDFGWVLVDKVINSCDTTCGIEWFYPEDTYCLGESDSRIMVWDTVHSMFRSFEQVLCSGGTGEATEYRDEFGCFSHFDGKIKKTSMMNECVLNPSSCDALPNSSCVDTNGGFLCICDRGFVKNELGECVDIDECDTEQQMCPASMSCLNTVGSFDCLCGVMSESHFPIPEFDTHSVLTIDGINGQQNNKDVREKSERDDVDLLGDIRFTSSQAARLAQRGVFPPERFIDSNPSLMLSERKIKGFARDADDTVKKWKDYFDETSSKYQVPWIFSPTYPPEWQPYVRAALAEFERSTCIKTVEISSSEVDNWDSVIYVHRGENGPVGAAGCWSYVGNAQLGLQHLSLSGGCTNTKTVQHEFIHALGFWHEQQRGDFASNINMNKEAYSCDESFWGPTYQCLMDCENGFSQWKDLHSPYDFDSIMHYYGNTCSDGSIPLMTHKGTTAGVEPNPPGDRMTTQDALQINAFYECPIQRTFSCNTWNYPSQSVYLESRRCDGVLDCIDGSDEDPAKCNNENNCSNQVQLAGNIYVKSGDANGRLVYLSQDKLRKLCFHSKTLIGHGYWIVVENVEGQEASCESTCGAIIMAELPEWSRCVDGATFKTYDSVTQQWKEPSNPIFYTATSDDNVLTTTTTTTTTTLGVNDYVQLSGVSVHKKYNGLYVKSGILNGEDYFSKKFRGTSRAETESHFLFLSESGNSWIVSSELNSQSGDLYLSVVGGATLETSESWFQKVGGEWIEASISTEIANNMLPVDECETIENPCSDPLKSCVDKLDGYSCECISGYVEEGNSCVDFEECKFEGTCESGYICTELIGSYKCVCPVSQPGHHDLPDISLTRRSDLGETKIQRSVRKENRRSLVDDLRFSKRQYNLMLKRGITISYESVSKSSLSNTRHLALLPTLARGADALVQKWTDTWDQSSKSYLVPYYFMSSYPEEYKEPIRMALEEFERSTCINFLEITEATASLWPAKILVHRGEDGPEQLEGCWSHLGKEETTQLLSLSAGCLSTETIHHEFLHALGFWHEQQRPDRDDFIDFHEDRFSCSDASRNANYDSITMRGSAWNDLKSPYDFDSVMHYDGNNCGPGYMTHKGSNNVVSPNNHRMSTQDALELNAFYNCPLQETLNCPNSASEHRAVYLRTRKCDGVVDCEDGSDESVSACSEDLKCPTGISLVGNEFYARIDKSGSFERINGHLFYLSNDGKMKLCYSRVNLAGQGRWIVQENLQGFEDSCDENCGAIAWAMHKATSDCITGLEFQTFTNGEWAIPGTSDYSAVEAVAQETCSGIETYNQDLTDNGFLQRLGQGLEIVLVIAGRGYLGDESKGKPAVPYWGGDYGEEGSDLFHNPDDVIRLGCKLGYQNSIGKPFMGTKCLCTDGVCQWTMNNPDFSCVSNDNEVSIPVWSGGTFNFIKSTFSRYLVMKTRVSNLRNVDNWSHDQIDHVAHPEYLTQQFWDDSESTLFVFCPFDVTLGGINGGDGRIAFADWYPSEQSSDGRLWSFLSREGTRVNRQKCELVEGALSCTTKSSYYKGYIDWSADNSERGPIEIHTGFTAGGNDYSCETGILPGHHPDAIAKLQQYFPIFADGDFSKMVNYLRNPPFDDTFTLN